MFRPGGYTGQKFSDKDILDFKITGQIDQLGRTTARYFEHEGRQFGFEDENTKNWLVSQRAYNGPKHCAMLSAPSGSRT